MQLPDDLLALLRRPSPCYLVTTMADGSPQVTQTWVDTDGDHVVINSARDPRVAVAIADPDNAARYFQVSGRVIDVTTEGAVEHIEQLFQKYLGTPYPWFGGRKQVRVIIVIEPESVSGMG